MCVVGGGIFASDWMGEKISLLTSTKQREIGMWLLLDTNRKSPEESTLTIRFGVIVKGELQSRLIFEVLYLRNGTS